MSIAVDARRVAPSRAAMSTVSVCVVAAGLVWEGEHALRATGIASAVRAGQLELAGPVVLGFVLAVFFIERLDPAQPRPAMSRGHLTDLGYLLLHGLLVVPAIVLMGAGMSHLLATHVPWLVLPRTQVVPRWAFLAVAVVALDGVNWLTHVANHRVAALWRLHAVHHSQEELSILTTFRTHPLVHVSFTLSAVPLLAIAANTTTPATLLTIYTCLGALPHANVTWSYGRLGQYLVSPAYHRRHHSPDGRLDVNLGTVLTVWDRLSARAQPPGVPGAATGLAGRPVPVEQGEPAAIAAVVLRQLAAPFRPDSKELL